jgi:hypothetical protein
VVERLRHHPSCAFADFGGSLDGAHTHILPGFASSLTDILGRTHGVQGHQIAGTFASAFGRFACSLPCAFANVATTVPDIASSTAFL